MANGRIAPGVTFYPGMMAKLHPAHPTQESALQRKAEADLGGKLQEFCFRRAFDQKRELAANIRCAVKESKCSR